MKYMKNKYEAYFTVEAALVMPIVIICILLVIYLWFFQYDRCLMEIDTNAAVMRALSAKTEDNRERAELIKRYLNEIYYDKYIAWNYDNVNIKVGKGSIYVERAGNVKFPFTTFGFWDGDNIWSSKSKVNVDIMDPAFIVRSIRKLKGGN